MTVYVLLYRYYDYTDIVGVYSTQALADAAKELIPRRLHSIYDIEVYVLDAKPLEDV
jgi:hypothetical protein